MAPNPTICHVALEPRSLLLIVRRQFSREDARVGILFTEQVSSGLADVQTARLENLRVYICNGTQLYMYI